MAKRYDKMTPEEQRAVDERDIEILRLVEAGHTYAEIMKRIGVSAPVILAVKRGCAE